MPAPTSSGPHFDISLGSVCCRAAPQFVDPAAGAVWTQLSLLGLTFPLVALACDSVWARAVGTAGPGSLDHPGASPPSGAGGVMIIGPGGTLAVSGSKS